MNHIVQPRKRKLMGWVTEYKSPATVSQVYSRGDCHCGSSTSTEGSQKNTGGKSTGWAAEYPRAAADAARAYM